MSSLKEAIQRRRLETPESNSTCYSVKAQIPSVRVKASDGKTWVLPWVHFVHGVREDSGEGERLVLTFASHEVVVTGHNLETLEEDIAHQRSEKLRALPRKHLPQSAGEPSVTGIQVHTSAEKSSDRLQRGHTEVGRQEALAS
jgi:hypothetical protein